MSFPDDPDFDSGLENDCRLRSSAIIAAPPGAEAPGNLLSNMGHMCHVAVVEVDPETGKVEILDYAAVHDAGTMVNPQTLGGHIRGGTANGIGSVLFEEYKYDLEWAIP